MSYRPRLTTTRPLTFVEQNHYLVEGTHKYHIRVAELLDLQQETEFTASLSRKSRKQASVELQMAKSLLSDQLLEAENNLLERAHQLRQLAHTSFLFHSAWFITVDQIMQTVSCSRIFSF